MTLNKKIISIYIGIDFLLRDNGNWE